MSNRRILKNKLIISIFSALLVVIACFLVYSLYSYLTLANVDSEIWDGVSVASSFSSGNGTLENPYVISNASEFIYFKNEIEGINSSTYADKYYVLSKNIDLGSHELSSIGISSESTINVFKGYFDGRGFTIKNVNIVGSNINNYDTYGLFTVVDGGSISNLNLENIDISPNKGDNPLMIGTLVGEIRNKTVVKNISVYDSEVSLKKTSQNNESKIGGLFGRVLPDVSVTNIFLDVKISSDYNAGIAKVSHTLDSNITNVISMVNVDSLILNSISDFAISSNDSKINAIYVASVNNNNFTLNSGDLDDVIRIYDENIGNEFFWSLENNNLKLVRVYTDNLEYKTMFKPMNFSFGESIISEHETGVSGDTAYLNDLESDYNYYIGLNYTYADDGVFPTGNNQNLYNDSNLVKVHIQYNGQDPDRTNDDWTGYVSHNERVSKFNYYKYYPVSNGYINIELIDNPYNDRPDGMGFGGWITSYSGAVITYDPTLHVYYAKVPVSDVSGTVSITFHARWVPTSVVVSNGGDLDDDVSSLSNRGIVRVGYRTGINPNQNFSSFYYYVGTVRRYSRYPRNSYTASGDSSRPYCYDSGGCPYYYKSNSDYVEGRVYYELVDGHMEEHYDLIADPNLDIEYGYSDAGYYRQKNVGYTQSINNVYDADGNYIANTVCNKANGCTYYELIQYSEDDNGNVSVTVYGNEYYRYVNRDTNIIVLRGDVNSAFTNSKPCTVTGINNGNYQRHTINISNTYIRADADLRLEYVMLRSSVARITESNGYPSGSADRSGLVYGNKNNLKVGRGITCYGNYNCASAVIGSGNAGAGSSNDLEKYRMIVESGFYNNLAIVAGYRNNNDYYIKADAIYGSDFDKANNDNTKLDIYQTAAGSFGGYLYSTHAYDVAVQAIAKSGSFGTAGYSANSSTSPYTRGIYVGGLAGGEHYVARGIIVEGGDIFNLLGGPLTNRNRTDINDIFINVKGGDIDVIIGGAGRTETYGNRIVMVTGGIVNRAIFGGSNGYTGSSGEGTVSANTMVYVGGNAVVGNDDILDSSSYYGEEIGSVFGIGNGNADSSSIGTARNSRVIINGGTIKRNVYGGGNYGAVGIQSNSQTTFTDIDILNGMVLGSIYGGGNTNGSGTSDITSSITIDMYGGTVGNIYGGSRAKGTVYGNTKVKVYGGTVLNDVYGGGEGGYTSTNNPGTFVRDDVNVVIGDNDYDTDILIGGNVYGGSAYGTVNADSNTATTAGGNTSVTINKGLIPNSVFGGGKGSNNFTPRVLGNVTVITRGGNIGNVYGGNDASGQPNGTDVVNLYGGVIGNAYGGGNATGQQTTDINLLGATITSNLFGGSNQSGTVSSANVEVKSGVVGNVFGGNNLGGLVTSSDVTVTGGTINGDIYGGGKEAMAGSANVLVENVAANDIFGGGQAANVDTTKVRVNNIKANKIFGGSNESGNIKTTDVEVRGENLTDNIDINSVYGGNNAGGTAAITKVVINGEAIGSVYGGGDKALSTVSEIIINSGKIDNVFGGGNQAGLTTSNVYAYGGTIGNVFGGSNESGDLTTANVTIGNENSVGSSTITVTNVYGGNNLGGKTGDTHVLINFGTINDVYGGGNLAPVGSTNVIIKNAEISTIYGGGKQAAVTGSTFLDIDDSIMKSNVYGGGDEGEVAGNTTVYVTNTVINGSLYAGGNGASAIVSGSTSVTVDGNSVVGSATSKAPYAGCVFGGGNAAVTGISGTTTSSAIVNIVGGHIYGNVYGGANTSVVYGSTYTNIGSEAVSNKNLIKSDINIEGTIFGGGESNAEGSEDYDWTFKSVIGAIDVKIDGTGYTSEQFKMSGSIFGSGNASSSEGTSTISVNKLGSPEKPSPNISIQRTDLLTIDNSYIELEGIEDRTNEYSDILYSLNQIKQMIIKNNTTLLLQRNANMLEEFYSGVDVNGELVPARVTIDEETKEVTFNVNNRLYMLANRNLNISKDEAVTSYGKVTGMTFFGMYDKTPTGPFYGVYDRNVSYGDNANINMNIFGGSYVLGLHPYDYDYTLDGFYTNLLSDDYASVITEYIDPTPKDTNFFRWKVGLNAINYTVPLTASKYSSLGTYNLSMLDFADGDTEFRIIGFNSEGLGSEVELVDPNDVPRVTENDEDANKVLGLALKAETREWTSYGVTEFVSEGIGNFQGTQVYKTDAQKTSPSFMFYLYHAKNITLDGDLGSVMIMLEAAVPKNEIEVTVSLVTITVEITAANYDDGNSYDASITYDKKYEMPSVTTVNITNKSQFTAYFSLFATVEKYENIYGINNDFYHVLTTSYALPVGTQITMIDYGQDYERPQYYYFNVTQEIYDASVYELANYHEVTYKLSDFIKMGSTSSTNTYDDAVSNQLYFNDSTKRAIEEFVFIVDMKETATTGQYLNNSILFEIRNTDNRAVISVLGIRQNMMKFSLYDSSNAVLEGDILPSNNYLYYDIDNNIDLETKVSYDQTENRQAIIDTNYESSAMGLNLYVYDNEGKQLSSSLLLGTVLKIDGKSNFADGDGVYRIKLSGKVSNLRDRMALYVDSTLPAGVYKMKFVLFSSDDGRHNKSISNSWVKEFTFTVIGSENAINVTTDDKTKVVIGDVGLNSSESKENVYNLTYKSVLSNPNVRVQVLKRDISTIDATKYNEVDFNTLFKNTLNNASSMGYSSNYSYEKMLDVSADVENKINFNLVDDLTSGTYKVVFKLYDGNQLIEEDTEYVIVTKVIENLD